MADQQKQENSTCMLFYKGTGKATMQMQESTYNKKKTVKCILAFKSQLCFFLEKWDAIECTFLLANPMPGVNHLPILR